MSVSLLVSLLPYWNYTNIGISPVLNKISFWIFLETFLGCWSTFSKKFWIFCMSVSVLFGSLSYWNYTIIGISPVLDKISFWFFWRHSWDVGTLVPNNSEFFVCLSVCYLAHFLTEITQILGYLQFWMRYLSENFWRHSWDVNTLVPNNSKCLVCLWVC